MELLCDRISHMSAAVLARQNDPPKWRSVHHPANAYTPLYTPEGPHAPAEVNNLPAASKPNRSRDQAGASGKPGLDDSKAPRMWSIHRLRFKHSLDEIIDALRDEYLDARLMPASFSTRESRAMLSSASTPSLRAKDGTVPAHARGDAGGNVRVVVRVRGFLPRGELVPVSEGTVLVPRLTSADRNRPRDRVSSPDESHHAGDDAPGPARCGR